AVKLAVPSSELDAYFVGRADGFEDALDDAVLAELRSHIAAIGLENQRRRIEPVRFVDFEKMRRQSSATAENPTPQRYDVCVQFPPATHRTVCPRHYRSAPFFASCGFPVAPVFGFAANAAVLKSSDGD